MMRPITGVVLVASLTAALSMAQALSVPGQQPGDGGAGFDQGWPKVIQQGDETFTVYQPQLERWQNNHLDGRAAVAVETKANPQPRYGVIWFDARTEVDKANRLVMLSDLAISKANFPSMTSDQDRIAGILAQHAGDWSQTIALDRVEAMLSLDRAERRTAKIEVKNDPPRIIVSTRPAVLVLVDGDPVLRAAGTPSLLRVINTRASLWFDQDTGEYWADLGQGFVCAKFLDGPWSVGEPPSAVAAASKAALEAEKQADERAIAAENQQAQPAQGQPGQGRPGQGAPPTGTLPDVYVSTSPAELIVLDGAPKLTPVEGTQLLTATNTTGNLFVDVMSQQNYVLLSGRWFKAAALAGPWQFVPQDELPADFARIPENDPKGAVLASVAGTPSAQEAAIANTVPQTATVKRSEAKFEATYDGDPQFQPIEGTPLSYAANSPMPVIRVDASSYYAVSNGVWFAGTSPAGPWAAAARVPAVIYTIPPSSPLHYVTYVRVYNATPDVIYVGYTPGYMGSYLSPDGVVVYGTGWYYRPWIGSVWYGPPVTWGFAVGFGWTSWGGWGWNFGLGWSPWWGPGPFYHPWWGPWWGFHAWWGGGGGWGWRGGAWWGARWGVANVAINNYNIYNHWGRNVVINQRPAPQLAARVGGPQPGVAKAGAAATKSGMQNNVFAGRNGAVYRRGTNGWERQNGNGWQPVKPGAGGEGVRSLEHENFSRKLGESRVNNLGGKSGAGAKAGKLKGAGRGKGTPKAKAGGGKQGTKKK